MTIRDLIGTYSIKGKNQDAAKSTYTGKLQLSMDHNQRVCALWNIAQDQIQQGTGFFKHNILVINFNYKGDDGEVFKGVVVYKCITRDLLQGFWSEEVGDPLFLGSEQAYRIDLEATLLN
jgi:hypothetical protein